MISMRYLAAAVAAFVTMANAQTQCPAGIPNVQADSNGVLYALVQTGFPNSGQIPPYLQNNTLSQLGCASICDSTSGCVASSYIPYNPSGTPQCAFFEAGATFPNPNQSMQFFSAISCAYLTQNPGAYPPPVSSTMSTVQTSPTPSAYA